MQQNDEKRQNKKQTFMCHGAVDKTFASYHIIFWKPIERIFYQKNPIYKIFNN